MAEKVVWKWSIPVEPEFSLAMPAGARVLAVQVQGDRPCIWALVDESAPREARMFRILGTGHGFAGDPGSHVGTFQQADGALVWHLFDAGPLP